MKRKVFFLFLGLGGIIACNKDKFNTKPSLKLKDISSHFVPIDGGLLLDFEFTDKEGDVDNQLYIRKIRTNKRVVPTLRDSLLLTVPDFPKHMKGEIEARLSYQAHLISAENPPKVGNPPKAENDTLTLKIVLRDKANNVSDTLTIEKVVIERN